MEMKQQASQAQQVSNLNHGPLLLNRSVCLPLFAMWPSFGYFNTVIYVNFGFAKSTTSANFRNFFVHGISYRPTDLSLLKEFSKKKSVLKIFIILFEQDCPKAVVHGLFNLLLKEVLPLLNCLNDIQYPCLILIGFCQLNENF